MAPGADDAVPPGLTRPRLRAPVSIRPARPGDYEPVARFCRARAEWFGEIDPVLDDYAPLFWHWWITHPFGLLLVAEQDGGPVGVSFAVLTSEEEAYLWTLQVGPDLPAREIRQRLILWAIPQYYGLYVTALARMHPGWTQLIGRFIVWVSDSEPGGEAEIGQFGTPEPMLGTLRAKWWSQDRAAVWAPSWMWRRLTWQDIVQSAHQGRAILHSDGYALLSPSPAGPVLSWCEGEAGALGRLVGKARAWARLFADRLWALLPEDPHLAGALQAAGFRACRTYTVWKASLDAPLHDAIHALGR
jgi:hypothetical protein